MSHSEPERLRLAVANALRGDVEDLPSALSAAVKLLQVTRDEAAGPALVSKVIETEPTLAVKVMRLVNSAYYGFSRRIRTIRHAVTILGLSTVREIALHLMIYDGLLNRSGGSAFDRNRYWQHSLFVAILSRNLARALGHPDPDSLYAAGLMHDLGKVILQTHGRISYGGFLGASAGSGNPPREDERMFFGVTHDQVGAVISEAWGLPPLVCRVQGMHHGPVTGHDLTPEQAREVSIVALADFIAWTQGIGSTDRAWDGPGLDHGMFQTLEPGKLELTQLLEDTDREIKEVAAFYGVRFPAGQQLRANLVSTAIGLSQVGVHPRTGSNDHTSHTAPHQSLDPDEFIPATLEALRTEFHYGRLLMMLVEPRQRSLVASHAIPSLSSTEAARLPGLAIESLSGDLVRCLRERSPVVVKGDQHRPIFDLLGAQAAAAVPVMSRGRLLGVLWLSGREPGELPAIAHLGEVQQVAAELGVALERSRSFDRERARAQTDALTRLYNRGMVDEVLQRSFDRAAAGSGRGLVVGLLDIDYFKRFNDRFGHQAGDDVLRIVADTLRSLTRPNDFIGRYGGEEFLFVLLNTDRAGAVGYAERIRHEIAHRGEILSERFPGHALTASIGLAIFDSGFSSARQLAEAADSALYRAKQGGRNRVVADWHPVNGHPHANTPMA